MVEEHVDRHKMTIADSVEDVKQLAIHGINKNNVIMM